MNGTWQVQIYDRQQQLVFTGDLLGPVELGRQSEGEGRPYYFKQEAGRTRLIVASLDEVTISRKHALLEPLPDERARLTNLSSTLGIRLGDGGEVRPGEKRELLLPFVCTLDRKAIRIQAPEQEDDSLHSLAANTLPPGQVGKEGGRLLNIKLPVSPGIEVDELITWLRSAMDVLQAAASTSDFFAKAAQALVDMVGLDSGVVLLCAGADWKAEAQASSAGGDVKPEWQPSRRILARIRQEKRTYWQAPDPGLMQSVSLMGVKAVVAAPILDGRGEVIGVLYGDRRQEIRLGGSAPITKLEAMLVELLASGVAAGLARLEQEKAALAARVQMEQFFTPELVRELASQPDLLKGRDCEVSILFADIRGFSRISERLGPAGTVEWITDVMENLSTSVLATEGVLVDYIGDELMAMWGAPQTQPDHAERACRAALAMLEEVPRLNAVWQPKLQVPFQLGIGINSGLARVGNTGSRRKFKYGPLGNTVNLASRVQGVNKYLKSKLLVTGSTHRQLGPGFRSRRLCKVGVVNIEEPVDLYELVPSVSSNWDALQTAYESALTAFEQQSFRTAARILGNILADHPGDGPALVLLSRTVKYLIEEPVSFDPVWRLEEK